MALERTYFLMVKVYLDFPFQAMGLFTLFSKIRRFLFSFGMYKRNIARCICIHKKLAGKTAEALADYDLAKIKTKIILWLLRGQTRVLGIVSTGYYRRAPSRG